ncbi:MAG: S1-like domain-containing RNA-binding protein [Thiolinea sp.]
MLKIGQYNDLRVIKQVGFGVYLDGGRYGEILLPRRYVPEGCEVDQQVTVFIYLDSEDRLIATTERPYLQVGECALLQVVDTAGAGAFLDWGLPKDLLVPFSEQETRMVAGRSYVVLAHLDERTESIIGTSRLSKYLSELGHYLKAGQAVDLLIYGRSELGYKAVINHTHLGQLYDNETFQTLQIGQQLSGYIKQVRSDLKIDLSLQPPGQGHVISDELSNRILEHLRARGGRSEFTDKTAPELIYQEFQVSKAQFKRALGLLYKQKQVVLEAGCTRLSEG